MGLMIEVAVFSKEDELIGRGLMRFEDLDIVDDDNKKVCTIENHPIIILENGDILYGIECWWIPLSTFITVNQSVIKAFGGNV